MSDSPRGRNRTSQDGPPADHQEEQRNTHDLAVPDAGYAPPSARRVRITSLQQWLDLCA